MRGVTEAEGAVALAAFTRRASSDMLDVRRHLAKERAAKLAADTKGRPTGTMTKLTQAQR